MIFCNCIICKQPFSNLNVFTVEGAKEVNISGMCEICFDALFANDEEECDYDDEGAF